MTRKHLVAVFGLVVVLGSTGTALAEGSWNSSMWGVRVGFQSRRWTDNHLDNNSTTIRFDSCTNSVTVRLWRDINNWPDENRGSKVLNCGGTATGDWGAVPNAGNYYFQIDAIGGITDQTVSVDVPFLEVKY